MRMTFAYVKCEMCGKDNMYSNTSQRPPTHCEGCKNPLVPRELQEIMKRIDKQLEEKAKNRS